MPHLAQETFVCIDCETTGLDPQKDQIIEVAAACFTFKEVTEQFGSLVNPFCEIPETSIAIHHITMEMVEGKPHIKELIPDLLKLISNRIIVGHGINFDIEVIALAAEKANIPCSLRQNPFIDTLRLARLYGDSPTNSLEQLRRHFNIQFEGPHRAMNDVIVNVEVFKQLTRSFTTTEQIFDVLSRPIALKNMPLGKHKGRPLREVPLNYLQWAVNKDFDRDLLFSIRSELKRRKQGNLFAQAGNPFACL